MIFLEKDLVKFFIDDFQSGCSSIRTGLRRYYDYDFYLEYILDSGKRIDAFANIKDKFFWLIEFKVTASTDSIVQLYQYYEEFRANNKYSSFAVFKLSIAAQFFSDECLFFCERLGIEVIHICPANLNNVSIRTIKNAMPKRNH